MECADDNLFCTVWRVVSAQQRRSSAQQQLVGAQLRHGPIHRRLVPHCGRRYGHGDVCQRLERAQPPYHRLTGCVERAQPAADRHTRRLERTGHGGPDPQALSGAWRVWNNTSASYAGSWSVRNRVPTTAPGAWSARAQVAAASAGGWSVRNFAATEQTSAWSVYGYATSFFVGTWSVDGITKPSAYRVMVPVGMNMASLSASVTRVIVPQQENTVRLDAPETATSLPLE